MTTLTAFYDLAVGPVSYDFVTFAVKARLQMQRIKASRLHIVIVPDPNGVEGMFRDKRHLYPVEEMHWRLWNICIPAAQLVGASVTLALDWLQAERIASGKGWKCWPDDWRSQSLKNRRHLVGDLISASRSGEQIPKLSASRYALAAVRALRAKIAAPRVVTMTLRNTYLSERNTDPDEWREVAKVLATCGWHIVLLRDVRDALEFGAGFGELNLDLRMATYQVADLNLQANNGAASLCWFSDAPYLMFDAGIPEEEWKGLFVDQGLPLGETWPWANAKQRVVYRRSTCEAVLEEIQRWESATS